MLKVFENRQALRRSVSALITCLLLHPGLGYADLANNLTIGNPVALSLGNAVTADPPGVDSIHYNPAGLARIHGRQGLFKLTLARLNPEVNFYDYSPRAQAELDKWGYEDPLVNTKSHMNGMHVKVPFVDGVTEWPLDFLIVPTGGAAFSPEGANYVLGTSVYSPMAAGYGRDPDDPGRYMGTELGLTRITYFAPTIGFKLTDTLSVGAGIHFSYQGAAASTELRVSNIVLAVVDTLLKQLDEQAGCLGYVACEGAFGPFEDAVRLEADVETPLSTTFSFGLLWEPTPWFSWGMAYESEGMNRMTGTYRLTYSEGWQGVFGGLNQDFPALVRALGLPNGLQDSPDGAGIQSGDLKWNLKTPAWFSTGISVQVLSKLKLNVDAKWSDYKTWEGLVLDFDEPQEFAKIANKIVPQYADADTIVIPRHYESVWHFAFGMEYQYNDRLTLRAGWEPRKSSIPWHKQDVLLPFGDSDGNSDLYSVGFGYDWKAEQHFDFALAFIHAESFVPAGSSTIANSENQADFLYNPYAGMNFKTDLYGYFIETSYTWQF